MLARPTLADPEIAAATFRAHLDEFWATGRPERSAWGRIPLDPLRVVIALPARKDAGGDDWYFILLGAEYYDVAPPTVSFVNPADWTEARKGTRWFPNISPPPWFGLHDEYNYPDGSKRQLVCFTLSAQYYMVDHSPPETTVWRQGRHTVAATLNRLAELLLPPHYKSPSG